MTPWSERNYFFDGVGLSDQTPCVNQVTQIAAW